MILKVIVVFLLLFPINLVISSSKCPESKDFFVPVNLGSDFIEDNLSFIEVDGSKKRKRKANEFDLVEDEFTNDFDFLVEPSDGHFSKIQKSLYFDHKANFDGQQFSDSLEEIKSSDLKSFMSLFNETVTKFPDQSSAIVSIVAETENLDWILHIYKRGFRISLFPSEMEVLERALDAENVELVDLLLQNEFDPVGFIRHNFERQFSPKFLKKLSYEERDARNKLDNIRSAIQAFQSFRKYRISSSPAHLLRTTRENVFLSTFAAALHLGHVWYEGACFISVHFEGEEGQDFGGLKIEWLGLLLESFLKHDSSRIFKCSTQTTNCSSSSTIAKKDSIDFREPFFIENEDGVFIPNLLYDPKYFEFIGSTLGLAFIYGVEVGFELLPSFYRILLDESYGSCPENAIEDLKSMDSLFYRNLVGLRCESDLSALNLSVDFDNLEEFIADRAIEKVYSSFEPHLKCLKAGFLRIIGSIHSFKSIGFDNKSFKKVLTGKTTISVEDFAKHVNQSNLTDPNTKIWIFEIIEEFSDAERMLLFSFITAKRTAPYKGLGWLTQKIGFHSVEVANENYLPSASTCHSILVIPVSKSKQILKDKLLIAINNCNSFDME